MTMINVAGTPEHDTLVVDANNYPEMIGRGVSVDLMTGDDFAVINADTDPVKVVAKDAGDVIYVQSRGAVDVTLGAATSALTSNSLNIGVTDTAVNPAATINVKGANASDYVGITSAVGAVTVALGEGDDFLSIEHSIAGVTADLGAGNDQVGASNCDGPIKVALGTGQDQVQAYGFNRQITITALDGGDLLQINGTDQIDVTLGNKANPVVLDTSWLPSYSIQNLPTKIDNALFVSATNDTGNFKVAGGNGNDLLSVQTSSNWNGNLTMGDGDDALLLHGSANNVVADVGAGNDYIDLELALNADISLGTGHDKVLTQFEHQMVVKAADGGDAITVFGLQSEPNKASITLGSGNGTADTTELVMATDMKITGEVNNAVAVAYVNDLSVVGGSGADAIGTRLAQMVNIQSGAGNDQVNVDFADTVNIGLGDGNDLLTVTSTHLSTIDGGAGNDKIIAFLGGEGTVKGGAGNDQISLSGSGNLFAEGGADGSQLLTVQLGLKSTLASGVGARAKIMVDGTQVGVQQVNNTTLQNYQFSFDSSLLKAGKVDVVYDNDAFVAASGSTPAQDRNLYVAPGSVRITDANGRGVLSLDPSRAIYDRGYGAAATDGADIYTAWKQSDGSYGMGWNGALRFQLDNPDALRGDEISIEQGGNVLLKRGEGVENIYGLNEKLQLGSDVAFDQLWLTKSRNGDYNAQIIGTGDKAVLHNSTYGSIVDKSGKTLSMLDMDNLVNAMASMTPPPMGQTTLTADQHAKLDSVLAANWH